MLFTTNLHHASLFQYNQFKRLTGEINTMLPFKSHICDINTNVRRIIFDKLVLEVVYVLLIHFFFLRIYDL